MITKSFSVEITKHAEDSNSPFLAPQHYGYSKQAAGGFGSAFPGIIRSRKPQAPKNVIQHVFPKSNAVDWRGLQDKTLNEKFLTFASRPGIKEAALSDYLNTAKQSLQSAGNFIGREAKNIKNVPAALGKTVENLGKNIGNPLQAAKNYYSQFSSTPEDLMRQAVEKGSKGVKTSINPGVTEGSISGIGRLKGIFSKGSQFKGTLSPENQKRFQDAVSQMKDIRGGTLSSEDISQLYQGLQGTAVSDRGGLGGVSDAARKGLSSVTQYLPGQATVKTLGAGISGVRAYRDDTDAETGRKKGLGERVGQATTAAGANILTHNVVPTGMGIVPGMVAGQFAGSAVRGLGGAVGRNIDNISSVARGRPFGVSPQEQANYQNRMRMARMLG